MNAPTKEKLFFYAGDEWKSDQGKVFVFIRSKYGLKSSALAWINHLSDILGNHLGFQSSLDDPGGCFTAATDKSENEYYAYILVYAYDFIIAEKHSKVHGHVEE